LGKQLKKKAGISANPDHRDECTSKSRGTGRKNHPEIGFPERTRGGKKVHNRAKKVKDK